MVFISIYQYPDKFIVKASGYDSGIVENIKKYKPRQWDPINNVWYIGIPNYNNFICYLESEQIPFDHNYSATRNFNVKANIERMGLFFSLTFEGLVENFKAYLLPKSIYKNNKITYPMELLPTILEKLKKEKIKFNCKGVSDEEEQEGSEEEEYNPIKQLGFSLPSKNKNGKGDGVRFVL